MKNKTLIGALVAVIIVGGLSFYGGMTYANGSAGGSTRGTGTGTFAGRTGVAGARGGFGSGGLTMGSILTSSATSMTVKMSDGSTKIVLFGTSTQVMKTTTGSVSDLNAGTNVLVTGAANSDGSVTAQNIQIRPAGMTGGFGARQTQ